MANFDPYAGMPDDFYYSPGYSAGAAKSTSSPFLEVGNDPFVKSMQSKIRNVVPNQAPAPDGSPSPWRFTTTAAPPVPQSALPFVRTGGYSYTPKPVTPPPFDRSKVPMWGDDTPAGGPSGPGNTPPGMSGSPGRGGYPWHPPQGGMGQHSPPQQSGDSGHQAPHWPPRPMGHRRGLRRPYWWRR